VALFDNVVAVYNQQGNYTNQQLKKEYKQVDDATDEAKGHKWNRLLPLSHNGQERLLLGHVLGLIVRRC
jgi:hypothetical protein